MNPVNIQLTGDVTALKFGRDYLTVKYMNGKTKGIVRISSHEIDANSIRRRYSKLMVEYVGAIPVGLQLDDSLIYSKPGFSGLMYKRNEAAYG